MAGIISLFVTMSTEEGSLFWKWNKLVSAKKTNISPCPHLQEKVINHRGSFLLCTNFVTRINLCSVGKDCVLMSMSPLEHLFQLGSISGGWTMPTGTVVRVAVPA